MYKYEHSRFLIERFDQYYEAVNCKGSFYLAWNSFLLGGICVGYLSLYKEIIPSLSIWVLFALLIISNILSLCFTVLALMPFLKENSTREDLPSLIFFGGITKHQAGNFREKYLAATDADILEDAVQQIHCLASGLSLKYKRLRLAGRFVVAQLIVVFPLLLLIILNIKNHVQ